MGGKKSRSEGSVRLVFRAPAGAEQAWRSWPCSALLQAISDICSRRSFICAVFCNAADRTRGHAFPQANFPEHNWEIWRFSAVPKGWWTHEENLRAYMKWLAPQLKIAKPEDWYKVHYNNLTEMKGRMMLRQWNYSLADICTRAFPGHVFLPWKFSQLPVGWWESTKNKRQFFEWAAKELKYNKLEDWYNVSHAQLQELIGESCC